MIVSRLLIPNKVSSRMNASLLIHREEKLPGLGLGQGLVVPPELLPGIRHGQALPVEAHFIELIKLLRRKCMNHPNLLQSLLNITPNIAVDASLNLR